MTPQTPIAQGDEQTIKWGGIPLTGNVSIKLYQGSVVKATVTASTLNNETFKWTVPVTLAAGVPYTIRVTWLSKPAVYGTSAPFMVDAFSGALKVTPEPSVAQGDVQTITWTGIPQTGNVSIKLYQNLALKATAVATTPNDGSFDWTVPATLAYGDYTLLVTWLSKPAVFGTAEFTVDETTAVGFNVTLDDTVVQGGVQNISWSGIPETGERFDQALPGDGAQGDGDRLDAKRRIVRLDGSGDARGEAPTGDAIKYTLRVTWLSKPTVFGTSAEFTVGETTSGPFKVTQPDGTEPIYQGTVQQIQWEGIPATGSVSIKLYQGTALKATVIASTPNDGSFDWTVPATLAAKLATGEAIKYTLRVTWLSKPAVFGTSAEFAVSETNGPFPVTQSGVGEVRQGSVRQIAWSGIPRTGNVKILLYLGTALKGTVSASAPNTGSFDWVVPGTQALGDYTLKVVWLSKPTVVGTSGPFSVIGP